MADRDLLRPWLDVATRPWVDVERAGWRYRERVSGGSGRSWADADEVRLLVPVFAFAVALVAAFTDPTSASDAILMAIPVAAFGVWARLPRVPLVLVSLVVLVPVVFVQRSGGHEPLMFEASVLAFVLGRWSRSVREAILLGMLAVASPVVVSVIETHGNIAWGIWILGIAFPWLIGRVVFRQGELTAALEASRRELAQQAMLEERRRIARDVHDFVGHGLAAVMLQVTSARHVLRRDPDAGLAEERVWAIEDCRHVSARLEAALIAAGERVIRAPAGMTSQTRKGLTPGREVRSDRRARGGAGCRARWDRELPGGVHRRARDGDPRSLRLPRSDHL